MAGWTGKRANVMYSKPEEPSFLKKFKERVGYKEDGGLSDKFAKLPEATEEDTDDRDDELPQVVSLKPGDITQEEYEKLKSEGRLNDLLTDNKSEVQGPQPKEEEPPPDGKILFRKPVKRNSEEGSFDETSEKKKKKEKKREKQKMKLLSFNEEEDEEAD